MGIPIINSRKSRHISPRSGLGVDSPYRWVQHFYRGCLDPLRTRRYVVARLFKSTGASCESLLDLHNLNALLPLDFIECRTFAIAQLMKQRQPSPR